MILVSSTPVEMRVFEDETVHLPVCAAEDITPPPKGAYASIINDAIKTKSKPERQTFLQVFVIVDNYPPCVIIFAFLVKNIIRNKKYENLYNKKIIVLL